MRLNKIVSIFLLLPILSIAQKSSTEKNILPRIVSISTDTTKGNYKEVRFLYDKLNRVIAILHTNCSIKKPAIDKPKVDTTKTQFFEYTGNNAKPFLCKMVTYEFNKKANKRVWKINKLQYFIYENGEKVRDSVFYRKNENGRRKYDYFEQTFEPFETNEAEDNPIRNIKFDEEKYDSSINPLNQLNIAAALDIEYIYFPIKESALISLNKDFHNWGIEFMWYFSTKNNLLIYTVRRGDKYSPPIYDNVHLKYTYNQHKLPVYCVALTKKIDNGSTYLGGFLKYFTFRYSK